MDKETVEMVKRAICKVIPVFRDYANADKAVRAALAAAEPAIRADQIKRDAGIARECPNDAFGDEYYDAGWSDASTMIAEAIESQNNE